MKEELLHYAQELAELGLLKNPEHLAILNGKTLLTLLADTDLTCPGIKNIDEIPLGNIGPSDYYLDMFRQAFAARKRNRAVLLCQGPYTVALSRCGRRYRPVIEDTAQIIGTRIKCTRPGRVRAPLGSLGALLVLGQGGLCVAPNLYDLQGCAQVLEKSCQAIIDGWYLGGAKPLGRLDCLKMRRIYQKKYAPLAFHS